MSEKPKFTPGPWIIEDRDRFHDQITVKGGIRIADCDDSNHAANAELIAAAPEMYDKLAWMQRQFDESDDEELVSLGWEIEELLKKARGEK